jgi:hypothetical protein
MENIEITARVIRKAVGELEEARAVEQRTFCGTELVRSLGSVLSGAFPLLLNQTQAEGKNASSSDTPFGARILGTVRAYVQLLNDPWDDVQRTCEDVLDELRSDLESEHHPAVLHALQEVVAAEHNDASGAARANRSELTTV